MFAASDQMLLQCPPRPLVVERRWQSNAEVAPNCPRCASPNTKFCYYNNYSFSQPRYFCKGCRRYWTKGGSLRNVPVGGGCRKSRRSKASVRPSQNDRASGGVASFGGSSASPGLPDPSSEEERENGSAGSDIDLAAVFAKFLNQDSSGAVGGDAEAEPAGSDFSNGSNAFEAFPGYSYPDSQLEDLMFECQMPSVLVTQEADQLLAGGDGSQREVRMQGASGHDQTDFGLETVLIDDLAGDEVLWSDSDQTNIPNFTWQQEFGSFSADDQSKISANIITENWSLFDLSSYEIFSTP